MYNEKAVSQPRIYLDFYKSITDRRAIMAMSKSNQAKPRVAKGTNPTTRDRGEIAYGVAPMQNKAVVSGSQMVMMQNASGQHTRRAPKKDILR